MSANLEAAVHEAQRYLNELPAPPNEANTCDWVIRPLLVAAGYLNHEILAQSGDIAKKIPDYTLLPSTDHAWFLEAKAWTAALESIHVDQAMNYAHLNGRRWVVLTNGKEWRLYDDHIQGKSSDRLVASATLQDTPGVFKLLTALSRDSILAQKVEEYASERRLREYLGTALADPASQVIKAIMQTIKKDLPSVKVDTGTIVEIIGRGQMTKDPIAAPTPVTAPIEPKGDHLFTFAHKGVKAVGRYNGKGFVILAGSQVAKFAQTSAVEFHAKAINKLIAAGEITESDSHWDVIKDITFNSPSAASNVVVGGASNGWDCWKDSKCRSLDKLFRSK